MKGIAILGSTGTIGEATLDVAGRHPDRFRVVALAAHSNHEALYAQLRPAHAALNRDLLAPITPQEQKLLMDLLIRVIEGNLIEESRNVKKGIRRTRRQNVST